MVTFGKLITYYNLNNNSFWKFMKLLRNTSDIFIHDLDNDMI